MIRVLKMIDFLDFNRFYTFTFRLSIYFEFKIENQYLNLKLILI